ncbi:MAG: phosphatidate cytidylyltransferase, partial [Blastocatellia bacterium]
MARIYSAIIFLPILFAAIWLLPPLYFCVLVGIAVALGLLEYFALTEKSSSQTGRLTAIPAATGILAAFYYQRFDLVVAALAALVFMEMTARLFENRDLQSAITTSATTIFGVMYVA